MADTAKDPVCGMNVDTTKGRVETYQGQTYPFCSESCREKFKADPGRYVSRSSSAERR